MKVLEKTIASIEGAGFSHIKVELEAQLDRLEDDSECWECSGYGTESCANCDGEGAVEEEELIGQNYRNNWVECSDCYGEGRVDCSYCEGQGNCNGNGNFSDEDSCYQYLLDHVSQEAKDNLTYGLFYNDHSVDSEFTFTVPASHAHTIVEWIKAFSSLADEIGNGLDVDGAGMHISVIPAESGGNYPVRNFHMPEDKLENFREQNTKLLPALYFLASANHRSRVLEYRNPRISDESKYSAVFTHHGTCFEYRLFETCYERPEAIFEYLEVIANTLKFYADPELEVDRIGTRFGFADGGGMSRTYDTPEQLRVLNAQIKQLKPQEKSIRRLKSERGVATTITEVVNKQKMRAMQLRQEYRELRARTDELKCKPLTEQQLRDVDYYMLQGWNRDEAEDNVRGISTLPTLREFLNRNLNRNHYATYVNV